MKYEVEFTGQFKKDLKLAKKQGKDINKLFDVIEKLSDGEKLDENTVIMNWSGIIKIVENVI